MSATSGSASSPRSGSSPSDQRTWGTGMTDPKRILTTHVGSLARPPAFVELMKRKERGEAVSDAEYTDTLEKAVAEVLRLQAETGIDIVSDGELAKPITWSRYVLLRMSG